MRKLTPALLNARLAFVCGVRNLELDTGAVNVQSPMNALHGHWLAIAHLYQARRDPTPASGAYENAPRGWSHAETSTE